MFLYSKTLYYDVTPFMYYVMACLPIFLVVCIDLLLSAVSTRLHGMSSNIILLQGKGVGRKLQRGVYPDVTSASTTRLWETRD